MARMKNALRGHFIAPFDPANPNKKPTQWLELAKWISSIEDDSDEKTEEEAYYDGDGTEEVSVVGITGAYSIEGTYDKTDPAQKLIADMKYVIGDGRKLWHKVVSSDETEQWIGLATVTDIVAGSGEASEYEAFSCKISFNQIPEKTAVTSTTTSGR